jgi:outer membrane protein assembly factor BamE
MKLRLILTSLLLASFIPNTACSFRTPKMHRLVIQQGNVVTQEMVDKLKPAMTREQVAFIMGRPVIQNPFNNDRWDYVYTIYLAGSYQSQLLVSLYFANDLLSHIEDNLPPPSAIPTEATSI